MVTVQMEKAVCRGGKVRMERDGYGRLEEETRRIEDSTSLRVTV